LSFAIPSTTIMPLEDVEMESNGAEAFSREWLAMRACASDNAGGDDMHGQEMAKSRW
jgi:hypothetical protein